MTGSLIRITPAGLVTEIDNEFGALSEGVGASFDFIYIQPKAGLYVGDESLLDGSRFNTVASMVAGRAIYGNAVLTRGDTDDEGETLPPEADVVAFVRMLAGLWRNVVENNNGQDVMPKADADAVPPMAFESFDSHEDMMRALGYSDEDIAAAEDIVAADGQHRTESI